MGQPKGQLGKTMSNRNIKGTHFQGPILGNDSARGGLFRDVPSTAVEASRSPYKVIVEDFPNQIADGDLAAGGAVVTAINTPTAATEVVTGAAPYLLINAGTKADSGSEVQFVAVNSGATTATANIKTIGPITSTTTLMDNKELFWEARVGFSAVSDIWDGKCVIGWVTTDTTLVDAAGVLSIATGGGAGFHVAELGALSYFSSQAAVTTATDSGINIKTDILANALSGGLNWYTLGCRIHITDASASTGYTEFYINGKKTATIVDSTPMASTQVYGMTFSCSNGGAQVNDLAVDHMTTGITRAGLTYPYSTGQW